MDFDYFCATRQTVIKMNKPSTLLSILAIAFTFASCGEDRTHEYLEMTAENQWTYSKMKEAYLWADEIKSPERSAFFGNTEKFYTSLLSGKDKVSYFTDSIQQGSYGIDCTIMRDPLGEDRSCFYALVTFVEPESPAAMAGIERGDWISSVGGKRVTSTSTKLMQNGTATEMTTRNIDFDDEAGKYFWSDEETHQVQSSTIMDAKALVLDTILNVREKKTGYILCNNFNGDRFTEDFNEIALGLAAEDVSNIILDLRYCTSGTLDNAAEAAAIFVPQSEKGNTFAKLVYNDTAEKETLYPESIVNLSDKKLYIVTGNATAGVAELFIAAIDASRGMHEVVTVGSATSGANVLTETFASPYGFSISPAVAKIFTPDGNELSAAGLKPDYPLNELAEQEMLYDLGNPQEYILRNVTYLIVNGFLPAEQNGPSLQ